MKTRFLIIGYGIDPLRREAISINTHKLIEAFTATGVGYHIFNIGYPNPDMDTGHNFLDAFKKRSVIHAQLKKIIAREKITHVLDVFALPMASWYFTLSLKKSFPNLVFLKEIHNLPGFSKVLMKESFLRALANNVYFFNICLSSAHCFSRNAQVARKYNLTFIPPTVPVFHTPRKNPVSKRTIRVGYLGHPLRKKGIGVFPELFAHLTAAEKKRYVFSFALSSIGHTEKVREELLAAANNAGVTVHFEGIVKPQVFFRKQDYYVLPIHDDYGAASTPNTVLEAMEAGAVPIVTRVKSLDALLHHQQDVYFINKPTAQEVLNALREFNKNQELREELKTRGRAFIIHNCTSKHLLNKIKKLYAK